jgi:hypothetical protein
MSLSFRSPILEEESLNTSFKTGEKLLTRTTRIIAAQG